MALSMSVGPTQATYLMASLLESTNLLCYKINYDRKKFYSTGQRKSIKKISWQVLEKIEKIKLSLKMAIVKLSVF